LEDILNSPSTLPAAILHSTRRRWMTGAVVLIGGIAAGATKSFATDDNGLSHSAEAIHQEIVFQSAPQRIYDALTDAKQFQQLEIIGGAIKMADIQAKPAQISREPGGSFSLFGAYIIGRQLELAANQRIVQAWREVSWDPGIFSIARFELKPQGSTTKLIFDHTGFPAGAGDHLAIGWNSHYWEPLQKYLKN
jgi:activator of HSP90 ATPase